MQTLQAVKSYAKFHELPLTALEPEGWVRSYLERQRDGLTGHLEAAGFPFNTIGWAGPSIPEHTRDFWGPYEQTGYWVDGMVRCGHLLRDDFLLGKAKQSIDYVLEHPDTDGYLGPQAVKPGVRTMNRWVHAVFFRALMAHAEATGDRGIVDAMAAHYLSGTCEHYWGREICNIEAVLWIYERTGDERLLQHAVEAYEKFNAHFAKSEMTVENMLSEARGTEHGVSYNEIAKLGAVMYSYTGNERFLQATVHAYEKLDRDQMLIDGVVSSSERLRGKDPLDSHETCDIADYTWSIGYLLMATGKAEYADKIERACFNAAPGAVRSDFKGLQYFSCPNQVVSDKSSNHNKFFYGREWMSYRPNPGTECCPGEVNRIMPNYVARMWIRGGEDEIIAALYGPSRVTVPMGPAQQEVTIVEETAYPFSERIDFTVRTAAPVEFTLMLRIPGWCNGAKILLNHELLDLPAAPGSFVQITRTFANNDRVALVLPMEFKVSHWPHGGIGVERGPLVYALRIEEEWQVDEDDPRSTEDFPAWNLYPASRWNYALAIDVDNPSRDIELIRRDYSPDPWTIDTAPIMLRVPARRVAGWRVDKYSTITSLCTEIGAPDEPCQERTLKGRFLFTPQLPDPDTLPARLSRKVEMVTLVPYGCTKLRIAIFPKAQTR